MGTRARVVLDPDTEVLHVGGVLLGDLYVVREKEKRREW